MNIVEGLTLILSLGHLTFCRTVRPDGEGFYEELHGNYFDDAAEYLDSDEYKYYDSEYHEAREEYFEDEQEGYTYDDDYDEYYEVFKSEEKPELENYFEDAVMDQMDQPRYKFAETSGGKEGGQKMSNLRKHILDLIKIYKKNMGEITRHDADLDMFYDF